jgi:hypothetical protein
MNASHQPRGPTLSFVRYSCCGTRDSLAITALPVLLQRSIQCRTPHNSATGRASPRPNLLRRRRALHEGWVGFRKLCQQRLRGKKEDGWVPVRLVIRVLLKAPRDSDTRGNFFPAPAALPLAPPHQALPSGGLRRTGCNTSSSSSCASSSIAPASTAATIDGRRRTSS